VHPSFGALVVFIPCAGAGSEVYEEPVTGMEFVFIKGGCFQMGSENSPMNERLVHTACVGDFFMAKYEVTQKQWKLVMGSNPSFFTNCGGDCPVESISWANAQVFIDRLNQKDGADRYRLSTEGEWEYAARAGSNRKYSFGDSDEDLGEFAWYDGNSRKEGLRRRT
jgi:formylglycine-generating enzyme